MIRTVLMDLSKAYDCILHDLNVAKFEAYDLDKTGLIPERSSHLQLYQKKRLRHKCFPVNFAKFLRIPFSIEYLWWPLLNIRIQWALIPFFHWLHIIFCFLFWYPKKVKPQVNHRILVMIKVQVRKLMIRAVNRTTTATKGQISKL